MGQALCSVVFLRPHQHEEVCTPEQSWFCYSPVLQVQYFPPVYKRAVKTNKKGILMCIFGGFILILILNGIWYFSLQVHYLETKYNEVKVTCSA